MGEFNAGRCFSPAINHHLKCGISGLTSTSFFETFLMPEDDARQLAVQERQHGLRCGRSEGAGHCRQDGNETGGNSRNLIV